ncbi:hypothetical protein [Thermosyntropha sp.]|uniref:hypothetical protein n=1 Tax=Thermosyntropha sp. TaxID=2740820 RepID=UPI0025EAAA6C|nr:hypothetical protein [Thermosyntropha sp.]MBO8158211.1 hypothetical protein [Thermosyntropha sp.]
MSVQKSKKIYWKQLIATIIMLSLITTPALAGYAATQYIDQKFKLNFVVLNNKHNKYMLKKALADDNVKLLIKTLAGDNYVIKKSKSL